MAKTAALLACLFLSGCQSWQLGYHAETGRSDASGSSPFAARASAEGSDRIMNGLVAAVWIAGVAYSYRRADPGAARSIEDLPELDPARAINSQDCVEAVDPQRGNLMCR